MLSLVGFKYNAGRMRKRWLLVCISFLPRKLECFVRDNVKRKREIWIGIRPPSEFVEEEQCSSFPQKNSLTPEYVIIDIGMQTYSNCMKSKIGCILCREP